MYNTSEHSSSRKPKLKKGKIITQGWARLNNNNSEAGLEQIVPKIS